MNRRKNILALLLLCLCASALCLVGCTSVQAFAAVEGADLSLCTDAERAAVEDMYAMLRTRYGEVTAVLSTLFVGALLYLGRSVILPFLKEKAPGLLAFLKRLFRRQTDIPAFPPEGEIEPPADSAEPENDKKSE